MHYDGIVVNGGLCALIVILGYAKKVILRCNLLSWSANYVYRNSSHCWRLGRYSYTETTSGACATASGLESRDQSSGGSLDCYSAKEKALHAILAQCDSSLPLSAEEQEWVDAPAVGLEYNAESL